MVPPPGRKELAGQSAFPGICPRPGAHLSANATSTDTQRLQFPVPTDMCRQRLWVGYQPDLVVDTDLCLSMSQAGTPTTRQVLSAWAQPHRDSSCGWGCASLSPQTRGEGDKSAWTLLPAPAAQLLPLMPGCWGFTSLAWAASWAPLFCAC